MPQYKNSNDEVLSAAQVKADNLNVAWDFNKTPPQGLLDSLSLTIYTPTPPEQGSLVPQSVTRRQALQILRMSNVTEAQIEDAINTIQDELTRDLALIEFRTSQVFERNRPLVAMMGAALGLDSAAMDNLFINAAALV